MVIVMDIVKYIVQIEIQNKYEIKQLFSIELRV